MLGAVLQNFLDRDDYERYNMRMCGGVWICLQKRDKIKSTKS